MGVVGIARTAHKFSKYGKMGGVFARLVKSVNRLVYACDIAFQVDIPESTYFPHSALGVVIHPSVQIGEECVICQNVTIGQLANSKRINTGEIRNKHIERGLAPTIGNNVFIGAGAVIIGGIMIGNNVAIGANAVVIDDIPDNAIAAGVPAEVKRFMKDSV